MSPTQAAVHTLTDPTDDPAAPRAIRLSAVLITRNEAARIDACLASLDFCDEIVVLDSGSQDDTAERCRAAGARVIIDPDWPGFGPQKNRAVALARGEWVLSIDADETVTPALRASILAVLGAPDAGLGAYRILRRSYFCGRLIHHGDWGNDHVLRLFRPAVGRFSDDVVHERVVVDGPVGTLDGILLHHTMDDLDDALAKMNRYSTLGADKLAARGRGGILSGLGHGLWSFLRGFLLRGGFRDGRHGFMIAWINAQGTFFRYVKAADAFRASEPQRRA